MRARTQLTPDTSSPRAARRFVAQALVDWNGKEARDDAVLLVDELVTNAVRHARTPLEVTLEIGQAEVRVEVTDASPLIPQPRDREAADDSGRGLHIVAALADAWGVRSEPEGKGVWVPSGCGSHSRRRRARRGSAF